ncbi:19.5g1 protein, partial [Operophtera brumata]
MAPKKDYTPSQMSQAVQAVTNGEKVAIAAKRFGVPRITLYNKITGKSPLECPMGPGTYLTQHEENILEKWLLDMADRHMPVTKEELLDSVQRIITDKKQETPFVANRPGKKWYALFFKRHPDIVSRTAQNLTTARHNVTEEDIHNWFKEVNQYIENNDLSSVLKQPERVFNTDESAFFLSPKPGKVLAKRGEKHVYCSSVLKTALEAITNETIKNGFRGAGLYPFGPEYVDMTKIKYQNRSQNNDKSINEKKELLIKLEGEITTTFNTEKLKLFNELFYKNRNELNDGLPEEDTSLFVLWAAVKSKVGSSTTLDDISPETVSHEPSIQEPIDPGNVSEKSPYRTISPQVMDKEKTSREIEEIENILPAQEETLAIQEPILSENLPDKSHYCSILPPNMSKESTPAVFKSAKPSTSRQEDEILPIEEKTPVKELQGMIIPSPFKRCLYWPEDIESKKGKKRKLKEKLPSTITSRAWRQYSAKKYTEKQCKLQEKEKRAQEREEKRQLKEKLNKDKQKKLGKKQIRKGFNSTSSDDTDTEIKYAESDDTYCSEIEDSSVIEISKQTTKSRKQKGNFGKKLMTQKCTGKIVSGSYVIIKYEGEFFPGIVENTDESCFEISTMTFSTGNTFRWPERIDKIWYRKRM